MANRRWATGAMLALLMHAHADAQTRSGSAIVTASVRNPDTGESGAGFLFRYGEQCVLITAGHVVAGAVGVRVETSGHPPETVKGMTMRDGLDVAVLPLARPAESCPAAPGENAIARAVQGSTGTLLVGLAGGGSTSTSIRVVRTNPDSLTIAPALSGARTPQGSSGGVIVMGGVPVAIQSDKETGSGTMNAVRLDYAARVLGPSVLALTADPSETPAAYRPAPVPAGYLRLSPDDPRFTASVSMEPVGHGTFGFTTQITLKVRIAAPPGQHISILSGGSGDRKFMDEWVLTTSSGECHASASTAGGLPLIRTKAERDAAAPMIISDRGAIFLANFADCKFGIGAAKGGALRIRILQKTATGWVYGYYRGEGLRFALAGAFGINN